jgi:dipeptidyl aminopeptidase/acylaminoacyl peptidase
MFLADKGEGEPMSTTRITAQDLYQINTLSDPQFSPDGQWLAYVHTRIDRRSDGYQSAIWLAPLHGSRLRQFTAGERRDTTPRWSPDGRWLAFVSNRGGDKAQIYVMATDGGEAQRLTDMENGAEAPVWSPDGKSIAFASRANSLEKESEAQQEPAVDADEVERRAREREQQEKKRTDPRVIDRFAYRAETSYFDGRTSHLYVVELDPETGQAAGKPRRVTEAERDYRDARWLPDGSALVAVAGRKPGEDDLFYFADLVRVPLASPGSPEELLTGPETEDTTPRPSPDGRWIAYLSAPVAELSTANIRIKLLPARGEQGGHGEPRVLTGNLDEHASDIAWSADSQSVCFLCGRQGRVELCRVGIEGGPVDTLLSAEREILAYDLSPDGSQAGFVASTDRAPWDLYVAALDGSQEDRLTEVNGSWLADRHLAEVEDLWFESADGTRIQGWIVKPPDEQPGPPPLVLSIHGGPHAMWSRHEPTMWHEWQMLAARGYMVFACNPRGSDGYGLDFRAALLHRWGEADLADLMSGVDELVARGLADPERLFITGGSYGGFMTAWVIGHDQRFKAAVAQRGVYDLIGFYSTSDIPLFTEWEFGANPWENADLLWRFSPLAYVENMHTPLLLIHSENDFRAPIPAAEGLFVALRRLRREVEMVRYPRDGHELSRSGEPKHRVDRLERIAGWFDRHLERA